MILNVCDSPSVMEVLRIVNIVINIIKIVVPIILIISCMLELTGSVGNSKTEKIGKSLVTKIVAAILIFLIPTFVNIIAKSLGDKGGYLNCLRSITREEITAKYKERMDQYIAKVEESLTIEDYSVAVTYLSSIKDPKDKKAYQEKLKEIKEQIEILRKQKEGDKGPTGTGAEEFEHYRKRAIEVLNSKKVPTEQEIEAAAKKVGMTKAEFIDAVEWAACENGHLMNPNAYCNGDMNLAATITYLNISGSINVLNMDSGCNHYRIQHMSKHEGMSLASYQSYFGSALKIYYDSYYNTYMKFAVAVADDLAPVYMWPPHADQIWGAGGVNGQFYYSHPFYIPPFDPFGTHDGFVTLRPSEDPSSPMLNPYDVVEWRRQGKYMWP